MTTITIPKNLIKEKDLMLISRLQYESLLERSKTTTRYERMWENSAKEKFLQSYNKSDAIYDQI
jgi:hypothetical protein